MPAHLIAASLLAADPAALGAAAAQVADHCDWLHLDVMDGRFVPNFAFSAQAVAALRVLTDKPFDLHLMCGPALPHIGAFAAAGADSITIHAEAEDDIARTLAAIRAAGKRAGLALKPETPLGAALPHLGAIDLLLVMTVEPGSGGQAFRADQLPKLAAARRAIDSCGRAIQLQVDGGINAATAVQACAAGADVLAAGTAIFAAADYGQAVAALREAA